MKASDLPVRCLENQGIRYVFGVPGEEVLDILDALLGPSIRFVPTRHEQGEAFMAGALMNCQELETAIRLASPSSAWSSVTRAA